MISRTSRALRAFAERDGRGYPDWAARYLPVLSGLRARKPARGPALEVGANANGLARFSGESCVVIDRAVEHLREARGAQPVLPVAAGMTALPFRDGAFPQCVCMDTLEHLPESARPEALAELLRVLAPDGAAVIGFPSGQAAAAAERRVAEACRRATGRELRWLAEHAEHGLPCASEIADLLQRIAPDRKVTREKNLNLKIWEWMWRILICGWPGRGNAAFQAALRLLTPVIARAHFGRCYRALLWIDPKPRERDPAQ